MNDNELKRKELENTDILELLHEMRNKENNSFATRECRPYAKRKRSLVSPYWLVAASMIGFVVGLATQRAVSGITDGVSALALYISDDSIMWVPGTGCCIASGDVNLALLRSR